MKSSSIRRSLLYIPGNSEKMLSKALELEADSFILDLEDSISINEKLSARNTIITYIKKFKEKKKEVIVRINDVKTKEGVLDIEAIVKFAPDAIIVPKADERAIQIADILLDATENRYEVANHKIQIIPLLETSYSILNAYSILCTSDRVTAVQFGAEDLTNELSITRTNVGNEVQYARNVIVYSGNTLKIDILDTPYTSIKDDEGLIKDAEYSKSIGFTGKTCIHPSQIGVVNTIFSPDGDEVNRSRNLIKAYNQAILSGKGAVMYEGKMIDHPIAERAKKLVERADLLSL